MNIFDDLDGGFRKGRESGAAKEATVKIHSQFLSMEREVWESGGGIECLLLVFVILILEESDSERKTEEEGENAGIWGRGGGKSSWSGRNCVVRVLVWEVLLVLQKRLYVARISSRLSILFLLFFFSCFGC